MDKYMKLANECARKGMSEGEGGPFGAVIIDKNGNIIAKANNTVIKNGDPTEHAEMNAIRKACKELGTYDLSDCILYSSCEPCPMCLSAIIWANIKKVYYACTREDAAKIGFRDDAIYEYLKGNDDVTLELKQIDRDDCTGLFKEYKDEGKTIY